MSLQEMDILMYFFSMTYVVWSIQICQANFFVLPSKWSVTNNSSLPSYNTVQGPFRAVADENGNPIASEDSRFGFGFVNVNSSGAFTLSIVMAFNISSPFGMEIWTANRNKTVGENAVLKIGSDGNLILQDADGSVACRFKGTGHAKAMDILNTGNFQIYNTTNSSLAAESRSSDVVWQSWDQPTDTLLPEQTLKTNSILISNASGSSASEGSYSLVMHPGGMVLLYTDSNGAAEPYWSWGLPGLDYQGILKPCFYNNQKSIGAEAYYDGQQLKISYNGTVKNSSESCPTSLAASRRLSPSLNDTRYRFLRLDDDGNVRAYRIGSSPDNNNASDWSTDNEFFRTNEDCTLPRVCGPYGMCANGECSCPGSGTLDYFQQIANFDPTQGCVSSRTLQCDASNTSSGHHFLNASGFDYFPNDFLQPEHNVSTAAECQNLCSSNCSCMAAFFRSGSVSCYLAGEPLGSLKAAANNTYEAFIKVQNIQPRNRSSTNGAGAGASLSAGSIAGIAVGSMAASLCLCLIVVVAYLRHRKKKEPRTVESEKEDMDPEEIEEEAFLKTLPGLPPRFSYRELRDATGGFGKRLGTGGFGSVYEGILPDGSKVAVKRLDSRLRQGYKEFRAEVATIGSISHVNLVRLRGFCADSRQRLLVYELLENGSLDKWLFPPKGLNDEARAEPPCLNWNQRYSVAVGTARGLAYLHEECRESIMHLDIKPQNILLDKNFSPKVSDFGMSKLLDEDMTQIVTAVRGTPGYLAPEWLRHSVATKKCDVYSFGMVLLELVSGRRNFDPAAMDPRLCYFPAWAMLRALEGRYVELVDRRLGAEVDIEGVTRMTKVAFWCIQDDPSKRPWMSVALKMLEGQWDVPDPPLWLLQRGPEFLQGYGYEGMEPMEVVMLFGNLSEYESIASVSATDVSGPR